MPDEAETLAVERLSALANPARLKAVRYLVRAGRDGAPAGEIAAHLGAQPSAVSFHLSCLADAGLITPTRASRRIIYRADFSALGELMGYLINDCCAGDPRVAGCC